jgi:hypothetical protein
LRHSEATLPAVGKEFTWSFINGRGVSAVWYLQFYCLCLWLKMSESQVIEREKEQKISSDYYPASKRY